MYLCSQYSIQSQMFPSDGIASSGNSSDQPFNPDPNASQSNYSNAVLFEPFLPSSPTSTINSSTANRISRDANNEDVRHSYFSFMSRLTSL